MNHDCQQRTDQPAAYWLQKACRPHRRERAAQVLKQLTKDDPSPVYTKPYTPLRKPDRGPELNKLTYTKPRRHSVTEMILRTLCPTLVIKGVFVRTRPLGTKQHPTFSASS